MAKMPTEVKRVFVNQNIKGKKKKKKLNVGQNQYMQLNAQVICLFLIYH